jgi:hypothetical protein
MTDIDHGWTKDQVDWLANCFQTGASFAKMAAAFSDTFQVQRSRNSILGKIRRMGLKRGKMVPQRKRKSRNARPPSKVKRRALSVLQQIPDRVESKNDCAWPEVTPCLKKAVIGPYCEEHARLAYRELPSEARIKKLIYS